MNSLIATMPLKATAELADMVSTTIIIVNYRTAALTIQCIASLATDYVRDRAFRVVLVDNCSPDDSTNVLTHAIQENGWGEWVTFIFAPKNGGFAYGNNLGLSLIKQSFEPTDYVLLLNPDTVVRPGAVQALCDFMNANPSVGIAGSRLENMDGTPQISAFRFPSFWSELDDAFRLGLITKFLRQSVVAPPVRDEAHRTDWVAGASMIIRRDILDKVGMLDENFFMYFEEVDFCFRAQRMGFSCWYVPESRVVHLVGQSSGIDSADPKPKRRPTYVFESRRRYFQKHYGRLYASMTDVALLFGNLVWRARRMLQRKPNTDPPHLWRDMFSHSSLFHSVKS